ncbi:MAG: choice-of-anchor T family protein [Thermoplasmatota archaeon]
MISILNIENNVIIGDADAAPAEDPSFVIVIEDIYDPELRSDPYILEGTMVGAVHMDYSWDDESIQYLIVELSVFCEGFSCWIEPDEIFFSRAQKLQRFTVIIEAPLSTSSKLTNELKLEGSWHSDPGERTGTIAPETVPFNVKEHYHHELEPVDTYAEADIGDTVTFRCLMINRGNGDDVVRVYIVNDYVFEDLGWTIEIINGTDLIPEGERRELKVKITTSKATPSGVHTMRLRIVSNEAESKGEISYVVDQNLTVKIGENKEYLAFGTLPIIFSLLFLLGSSSFIIRRRR